MSGSYTVVYTGKLQMGGHDLHFTGTAMHLVVHLAEWHVPGTGVSAFSGSDPPLVCTACMRSSYTTGQPVRDGFICFSDR